MRIGDEEGIAGAADLADHLAAIEGLANFEGGEVLHVGVENVERLAELHFVERGKIGREEFKAGFDDEVITVDRVVAEASHGAVEHGLDWGADDVGADAIAAVIGEIDAVVPGLFVGANRSDEGLGHVILQIGESVIGEWRADGANWDWRSRGLEGFGGGGDWAGGLAGQRGGRGSGSGLRSRRAGGEEKQN
jgi:hypothetical protein